MNQENNISILNFWWAANYGANLTAYALQQLIENSILVDNSDFQQYLGDLAQEFHHNFVKKYLQTSDVCRTTNSLCNLNRNCNTFIVGSDQVFRPKLNKRIADTFLLDFANINSKKIAFSASFGVDKEKFLKENSKEKIERMRTSLKSFDFISCREKSGVEICRDLFDVKAEWIIDPVFIADKDIYDELLKKATSDYSDKIVSYLIGPKNKLTKYYDENVVQLANSNETVENWLSAIKTCKLLITDSFHGMCFALIFNKPFICIVNSSTGSTRYDSVFELLGIGKQCITNIKEIYEKDCIFKVDYDVVNKRIDYERQRSLDFLKMALEAPVQVTQEKIEARMKFLENKVCELEQQATLKYQIKKELWNLWLVIFHKYLPEPVKTIISLARNKYVRK